MEIKFFIPKILQPDTAKYPELEKFCRDSSIPADKVLIRAYDPARDSDLPMLEYNMVIRGFVLSLDPSRRGFAWDRNSIVIRDGRSDYSPSFDLDRPDAVVTVTPKAPVLDLSRPRNPQMVEALERVRNYVRTLPDPLPQPKVVFNKEYVDTPLIAQARSFMMHHAIPGLKRIERRYNCVNFTIQLLTIDELEVYLKKYGFYINHFGEIEDIQEGLDLIQYWQKGEEEKLRYMKEYPQCLMFLTHTAGKVDPVIKCFKINTGNYRTVRDLRNRIRAEDKPTDERFALLDWLTGSAGLALREPRESVKPVKAEEKTAVPA